MSIKKILLVCSAILLSGWVSQAKAALVTWNIDSSKSWIRLTIPDQIINIGGGQVVPAFLRGSSTANDQVIAPWADSNKRLAGVQGSWNTNYVEGTSIQFSTGTHSASIMETGTFAPDRNSWDGTNFGTRFPGTAAAFAADLTLQGVNKIAKLNMYNFALDAHGTLALAGGGPWAGFGSLNAGALAGATLDLDGGLPGAGLTLADSRSNLGALIGNSILGINGSLYITNTGGLNRQMTMAYNVPFVVLINGLPLNGSFEANIVSTTTVPEPASVGLVGLALSLCALKRRRPV